MRTAYDFSPLYRSMIGVDRMANLIETAMKSEGGETYPPYDIQKTGEDTYRLTMAVERNDTDYRLNDINAVLGNSDLHGNLTVDTSQKIPALAGKMASRVLTFSDLGPLVRGGQPAVASKYLLPDTPMHTERLRQTNAEVDYSAATVKSRDFPLTSLDTHISVQNAVLNLKPLAFGFTQGKLAGSIRIDARKEDEIATFLTEADKHAPLEVFPCRHGSRVSQNISNL